jgi:hypothetical protein
MIVLGGNGAVAYNLTRSLRFRASATSYLSRTPAASSNQSVWTWSAWVKRGKLGVTQTLFSAYSASNYQTYINFTSGDNLQFNNFWGTDNENLITTQVFRDPSAWYHIVVNVNLTAGTYQNAIQMFVNGVQITAFSTTTFTNAFNAGAINGAFPHAIGQYATQSTNYSDLYLAEVNFVNGQQLTPPYFGSTNSAGVWQPIKYSGAYSTNGFYLPFTDNSALTTSSNVGLGKDFSGNSNYWTTNNISITAGVTYDSMTDVPTLTSITASNFPVFNPLDKNANIAVLNGNLQTQATTATAVTRCSMALPSSGKFYFEQTTNLLSDASNAVAFGICSQSRSLSAGIGQTGDYMMYLVGATRFYSNSSYVAGVNTLPVNNDITRVAVDITNGKMWVGNNSIWYSSNGSSTGDPANGLNPTFTGSFAGLIPCVYYDGVVSWNTFINFGQQPFSYSAPSGFTSLNTYNLPTPTIVAGNKYMDATLYTGAGAAQTVTNAASFKPDFVWIKGRSNALSNYLFDSVRGIYNYLSSDTTAAEGSASITLTSFNSNGFSLGGSNATGSLNTTFVGWQWQAGQGSSSSNTNGLITSTVSVNPTAGFSVVTYTGTLNATGTATVGHGLSVAPSMIISKSRNVINGDVGLWDVRHTSLPNWNYILQLQSTAAQADSSGNGSMSAPTSTVFSVNNSSGMGVIGDNYVAYCWTAIPGFSAFGSYTGNGSTDGPFVYCGFQPKFIFIKRADAAGNDWWIEDSARNPYNQIGNLLFANQNSGEVTGSGYYINFLSNGFKIANTAGGVNTSGGTHIYAAFASNPFKNSLAF